MIDFTATWCGPCKTVAPIYKGLSENTANVVFCKVDIDEAQPVALEAGIKVVRRLLDGFRSDMTFESLGPNFHIL